MSIAQYQRGFSLLELLVGIVLVSVMSLALFPSISGTLDYGHRQTTSNHLQQLKNGLARAYRANALSLDDNRDADEAMFDAAAKYDSDPAHALVTGPSFEPGASGNSTGQSGFEVIARYTSDDRAVLVKDGFDNPFKVFISRPLTRTWRGYTVHYRTIAIVSNNGGETNAGGPVLAADTSFDTNTGELTLGDSDSGIVVSGYPIEVELYAQTLKTMKNVARRYESFFTAERNRSDDRSFSIDYFSEACSAGGKGADLFADDSAVTNTCGRSYDYPGPGVSIKSSSSSSCADSRAISPGSGFAQSLGLSDSDIESAWGTSLGLGHGEQSKCSGSDVIGRTPANPYSNLARPPYTALIQAWAPGGTPLVVVASGG